MSYVKHILLPGERVMYDGRVHPTVLIPGTAILGLAVILLTLSGNTGGMHSVLLSITGLPDAVHAFPVRAACQAG